MTAKPPKVKDLGPVSDERVIELIHVETRDEMIFRLQQHGDNANESWAPLLKVNPNALALLETFPSPLAIVSVNGKMRRGKSTLLNLLLMHLGEDLLLGSVFKRGVEYNTVTPSISMYKKPLPVFDDDGSILFHVLILDSEEQQGENELVTAQITAVTAMLSTLMIMDIDGGFTKEYLGALESIESLISLVEKRKKEKREVSHVPIENVGALKYFHNAMYDCTSGETHPDMFPRLLVVSKSVDDKWMEESLGHRDTKYLGTKEGQEKLDAILETHLKEQGNDDPLDPVRESMKAWFPHRGYQVLYEATEEDKDALAESPPKLIKGNFRNSYRILLDRIMKELRPKVVDKVVVTPKDLAAILRSFMYSLEDGHFSLPTILYTLQHSHGETFVEQQVDLLNKSVVSFAVFEGTSFEAIDEHISRVMVEHQLLTAAGRKPLELKFDELNFLDIVKDALLADYDQSAAAALAVTLTPFLILRRKRWEEMKQKNQIPEVRNEQGEVIMDPTEVRLQKQEAEVERLKQDTTEEARNRREILREKQTSVRELEKTCCIGRRTAVLLPSGKSVRADTLKVGDIVASQWRKEGTEVFWVDHRPSPIVFLELHLAWVRVVRLDGTIEKKTKATSADSILYITPDHLLYANGELVQAGTVKEGDVMKTATGRERTSKGKKNLQLRETRRIEEGEMEQEEGECQLVVRKIKRTIECPSSVLTLDGYLVLSEGAVASCYEVSHTWGVLEALDLRLLYSSEATRWMLSTPACKKYSDGWDVVLEPLLHGVSHHASKLWKYLTLSS